MLKMTADDTILSYKGQMSYETIGILLNMFKREVEPLDVKITIYKKILTVMIESLENVFRYRDSFENSPYLDQDHLPYFNIENREGDFVVTCANPILNSDVEKLRTMIERVNALDHDGLKNLYKNTITNGRFSHKGGAGLGFIEMAKVSGNKLEVYFDRVNEVFSYFTLIVRVAN
jgi:hypothetical protein